MSKSKELKANDDLHIQITNAEGTVLLDEWGCTTIAYIVSCRGEMARSFQGAHNPALIKVISKVQKDYIKDVARSVKEQAKLEDRAIKVMKKKSKADDKMLDNVDLSKAKEDMAKMSAEYGVDVEKIIGEEIEKFKSKKAEMDAENKSMDELNPSESEQKKNAQKVNALLERLQTQKANVQAQQKKATSTKKSSSSKKTTNNSTVNKTTSSSTSKKTANSSTTKKTTKK